MKRKVNEYGEELNFWFEWRPMWYWNARRDLLCRLGRHYWMNDVDPRIDSWCSGCPATKPQEQTPERLAEGDRVNALIERTVADFNKRLARDGDPFCITTDIPKETV